MALQIWLPLNGDLHNQGLSTTTITNNGATVDNNGKIGKCYSTNGSNQYINCGNYTSGKPNRNISICFWIYPRDISGNKLCAGSQHGSNQRLYFGILDGGYISFGAGGTGWGQSNDCKINANTWYHIALTFNDTGFASMYINSQITQTRNTGTFNFTGNFDLGRGNAGESYRNAAFNDFRIYDHCLSAQEVKEISKGLVIHYPLDDGNVTNIAYDCSGYCNNGTITGTLTTSTDTPRYDKCYTFGSNKLISTTASGSHILTMSIWAKDAGSIPGDGLMFKDHLGDMALGIQSNILYSGKSGGGGAGSVSISNISYTANTWHHWVMVNRNGTYYVYMDGQQVLSGTSGSWGAGSVNALHIGGRSGSSPWPGKLSDFRAYCTALSADDIKALYQEAAFIDHKGNVGCYQFEENVSQYNMLRTTQEALSKKVFENGLNKVSQNNISCTLTDNGFKIYRNPNVTSSTANSSGQSNWGGLVINNTNNWLNLTKTHTYLIEFDIYGVSDRAANDIVWSNNIGWGGGGLSPTPSNVVINNPVSATFNEITSQHFSYKFTINDDVYKTCTSSYSSFIQGNSYLSYNGFKFGWGYTTTGSVGTEIYINNLRMFDITSNVPTQIDINKQGQIEAFTFTENGDNAFIDSYYGMNSNQLIEI